MFRLCQTLARVGEYSLKCICKAVRVRSCLRFLGMLTVQVGD